MTERRGGGGWASAVTASPAFHRGSVSGAHPRVTARRRDPTAHGERVDREREGKGKGNGSGRGSGKGSGSRTSRRISCGMLIITYERYYLCGMTARSCDDLVRVDLPES